MLEWRVHIQFNVDSTRNISRIYMEANGQRQVFQKQKMQSYQNRTENQKVLEKEKEN